MFYLNLLFKYYVFDNDNADVIASLGQLTKLDKTLKNELVEEVSYHFLWLIPIKKPASVVKEGEREIQILSFAVSKASLV